jgi:hypothetical protein
VEYCGTQGSNAICVFGYNMASTGWSEETAKKNRALDFICGKGLAYEFNNNK